MNILVIISRILVGSLFIVSGLIKANDALGFSYKLIEYFEPGVLNLEFLIPIALPLSMLICIVEVVLGITVLFGMKSKVTAWSLLLMIVFFTFLTFYSAYFNKVTDCGCFGDAIKLTPWESFTKDVVLLFFVLIIFIKHKSIEINTLVQDKIILPISLIIITIFSVGMLGWNFPWLFSAVLFILLLVLKHAEKIKAGEWIMVGVVKVFIIGFTLFTYAFLPIKDFRPYAVGKNITEGMKSAEELGLEGPVFAYDCTLKNKASGEILNTNSDEYMSNRMWEEWDFVEATSDPYKVKDGYEPKIHDCSIINTMDEDVTEAILNLDEYYFFVVCYDITATDQSAIEEFNALYKAATQAGVKVFGLTAGSDQDVQKFKHATQSMIDFYRCDGITLKTIVRSNPGIVLLKKGTILAKWHHNAMPEFSEVQNLYLP